MRRRTAASCCAAVLLVALCGVVQQHKCRQCYENTSEVRSREAVVDSGGISKERQQPHERRVLHDAGCLNYRALAIRSWQASSPEDCRQLCAAEPGCALASF
eukprot:Hpha_TRINITY_DN20159_c0_g1::TRINITY_DN20159_c0_g1_i1::g.82595::m.82595